MRDGHAVVSSAWVLRQGVARVSELRQFPPPRSPEWRREPEPVDDAPQGRPSRLFAAFDQQVALFAESALREAAYLGGPGSAGFSPLVRHAVYEAVHEASRRDGVPAGVRHLLAAMYDEPDSAAVQLAQRMWVTGHGRALLDRQSDRYRAGDEPPDWAPFAMKALRVVPSPAPRALRVPWRAAVATGLYFLVRRPFRRHGARYGHPVLLLIEYDARKQAVRLGHAHTGTVELLLSMLDLHEQLRTAGMVLPEPVARHNTAGQILRGHGVTLLAATMAASHTPATQQDAADLAAVPIKGWPSPTRGRWLAPPLDPAAILALRSASIAAWQAGDPFAGTTHLLKSILRDGQDAAARLLHTLGVNTNTVAAQATAPAPAGHAHRPPSRY